MINRDQTLGCTATDQVRGRARNLRCFFFLREAPCEDEDAGERGALASVARVLLGPEGSAGRARARPNGRLC